MGNIIDARISLPFELRPPLEKSEEVNQYYEQYNNILNLEKNRQQTLDDLINQMNENGVTHGILHAEYEYGDPADELNEAVAKVVQDYPDLFSGFGTISMNNLKPMKALSQINQVKDLGLIGLNIQPAFFNMAIDDKRLYPVYAKASELGLIVAIHTGINYSRPAPMRNEHPLMLDQIASDFPDLTIIACHGSWPWIPEIVAVARRHPNVLLDFGGLSPKYIAKQGSGWEVLYQFINLLSDQILFATDWPVFPLERAIREWKEMGLREDTLNKLMFKNAEHYILKARKEDIAL